MLLIERECGIRSVGRCAGRDSLRPDEDCLYRYR
jgi:hypothetical protein